MKRVYWVAPVLVLLLSVGAVAGQFYGGRGYLHTNTALTLPPGALDLSDYARAYAGSIKPSGGGASYILKSGTAALAASFGFSRHAELGFTQILYQDLNGTPRDDAKKLFIIPGDTYLKGKYGGYSIGQNMFWGAQTAMRYRVGLFHDIQLEPYEGAGIELELSGLLSYYVKPLYPDEAPSYHFNLGYLHHNDGEHLGTGSQEINWLVSAFFPRPRFDYGFELFGANFLSRPPLTTLGREDWIYVTPMVRYKLFKGLTFTLGLDLLMLGHTNTSVYALDANPTPDKDAPNYASYRISWKISFSPSTAFYAAPTFVKADEAGTGRQRSTFSSSSDNGGMNNGSNGGPAFGRQELFRWGIEERAGDVQNINLDLEKLRQDRKKAEEELKALKLKLEEKQRANP